jgi:acyl carrier protein
VREAPEAERQALLEAYLRQRAARALRVSVDDVPTDLSLIELGLDSIMIMELILDVTQDLDLDLYPREAFEHPSITAMAAYLVREIAPSASAPEPALGPLQLPLLGAFSAATARPGPQQRNPTVVFLLSAPRAGSTLLRVMLAGHPGLFCPPELHLLPFGDMGERGKALSLSYLTEGLQRAVMHLKATDAAGAKAWVAALEERDRPIWQVYGLLQQLAAPRLLVDKSPTYGASERILERAEALFDMPKYIHLTRHPYASIDSFVRNRFDKMLGTTAQDPIGFAEQVWATINHNVSHFLKRIEPARQHRVRYEQLVAQPRQVMEDVCAFLGIPFDEAVLKPYEDDRMTDGVHKASLPIGDRGFLKHDKIDPTLGEAWQMIQPPRELGEFSKRIAADLGYELPMAAPRDAAGPVLRGSREEGRL